MDRAGEREAVLSLQAGQLPPSLRVATTEGNAIDDLTFVLTIWTHHRYPSLPLYYTTTVTLHNAATAWQAEYALVGSRMQRVAAHKDITLLLVGAATPTHCLDSAPLLHSQTHSPTDLHFICQQQLVQPALMVHWALNL